MPAKKSSSSAPDYGSGTYEVAGSGLVLNGETLDGNDPDAVAAYHERDAEAVPAATEAMQERDAVLSEQAVAGPGDSVTGDGE